MKKIYLLTILFIFSGCFLLKAQNCDELYQKGQTLMSQGIDCGTKTSCIQTLREAVDNFSKAKKCYFDSEKQNNCQFNIDLCNKQIRQIQSSDNLTAIPCKIENANFTFGADGGESSTSLSGTCNDPIQGSCTWCTIRKEGKKLIVNCLANTNATPRVSVDYSINNQTVSIQQAGKDCRLDIDKSEISFISSDNSVTINISSDDEWNYAEIPSWIIVSKNQNELELHSKSNESGEHRSHTMRIYNNCGAEKRIILNQESKEIEIYPQPSNLSFTDKGGSSTVQITTAYPKWKILNYPDWCVADKSGNYVQVRCTENTTSFSREGIIVIEANGIKANILIKQNAKESVAKNDYKKFYVGFYAGITMPFFSTKSANNILTSAIDYSSTDIETLEYLEVPNYNSKVGFNVAVSFKINLIHGLYLEPSIKYSHFSLTNHFSSNNDIVLTTTYSDGYRTIGLVYDFNEKYTFNYLDIPILLSYKLMLAKRISINFKTGPSFSIGVAGKGTLKGDLNYTPIEYWNLNWYPYSGLDGTYYANSYIDCEYNLYSNDVEMNQAFSTGDCPQYNIVQDVTSNPFKRFNMLWDFGVGFEFYGFEIDVLFNLGLMNIANNAYWEGKKIGALIDYDNQSQWRSTVNVSNYKHKIHTLEIRLGYSF